MNYFLCGLGNPGRDYTQTRHNVGFMIADLIAAKVGINFSEKKQLQSLVAKSSNLIIFKPQTYMNKSGRAVSSVTNYFGAEDISNQLIVIHDDLDIEFGKYKISKFGPKVHNGVLSVDEALKVADYWHVRVGVDSREGDRNIPGRDYVLQKFPTEQIQQLNTLGDTIYQEIKTKIIE